MDIDLLSKMVKELILDEDKVVLPGFGCFVAEIVPASFSDKGYTINPPYRRLYFRSRPDEGTELVDFYAKSNGVDYAVAEKIISDFLTELKSVIYVKKTVVFPGLGRLRATKENNLFFVADEDLDIFPAGFGLSPVSLKTHQETKEEVAAAVAGLKNILDDIPAVLPVEEPEPVAIQPEENQSPIVSDEPEDVHPEPIFEPLSEPAPAEAPLVEPESLLAEDPEPFVEEPFDPVPVPNPVPVPEPEPEPEPEPVWEIYEPAEAETKKGRKLLKAVVIILVIILLLFAAYMLLGRLCPEWIDQFLYSPEELEILNR